MNSLTPSTPDVLGKKVKRSKAKKNLQVLELVLREVHSQLTLNLKKKIVLNSVPEEVLKGYEMDFSRRALEGMVVGP